MSIQAITGSSAIAAVEFHGNRKEKAQLDVFFHDGKKKGYLEVPGQVVDELLSAKSVGHYFNMHIRDRYKEKDI